MNVKILHVLVLVALSPLSWPAWATSPAFQPAMPDADQEDHASMDHSSMQHPMGEHEGRQAGAGPVEQGQAAFAAIAEATRLLQADPAVDWSKVDMDRLRDHLVDMNELMLNAVVATRARGDSVQFEVTGTGRTTSAIRAMVPVHATILTGATGWTANAVVVDNGAVLTVSGRSSAEVAKIKALGFFGIMASGHDHASHHLAMVRGGAHGD